MNQNDRQQLNLKLSLSKTVVISFNFLFSERIWKEDKVSFLSYTFSNYNISIVYNKSFGKRLSPSGVLK